MVGLGVRWVRFWDGFRVRVKGIREVIQMVKKDI